MIENEYSQATKEQFQKYLEELKSKINDSNNNYWNIDYSKWNSSKNCGVYSIRIDDFDSLSEFKIFDEHKSIKEHSKTYSKINKNIIYIGDGKNVRKRLLDTELGGDVKRGNKKQRGTFWRKLGSLLGFKSVLPEDYIVFNVDNNKNIICWIEKHLKVKYFDVSKIYYGLFERSGKPKLLHRALQDELIKMFRPVFNGAPQSLSV